MAPRRRPSRTRPARSRGRNDIPTPQLATLAAVAPEGPEWAHEIKYDGYRLLALLRDGRVRLLTRNARDWTDRFPELVPALADLPAGAAILDGEVVVQRPDGVSSFQALQNHLRDRRRGDLLYYIFDLLALDNADLREMPLSSRKERLAALLSDAADPVRYSEHVVGRGEAFFRQACRHGLEGIISKRMDGPYRPGRGRDWLKVKCQRNQEFVVVGYTEPGGSRSGFGALVLAARDGAGEFRYTGRVGTGFTDRVLLELRERLASLEAAEPPVSNPPRGREAREITWVRPELVAEIRFTDWTDEGLLRHPSFQGVREDKSAEEVWVERASGSPEGEAGSSDGSTPAAGGGSSRAARPSRSRKAVSSRAAGGGSTRASSRSRRDDEAVEVAGVRLTNPHKVLFAAQGITKLDLARYYESVADWMLPHLADRPLTLVRCPAGRDGHCFYQKHMDASADAAIRRVAVDPEPEAQPYGAVDSLPGLVALVQMGVLEIHSWGSRRDRLELPDRITFDLDPDEGLGWTKVIAAAREVRDVLEALGLSSFLKTTGGKGLHLVVPIRRKDGWDVVKEFAHSVAAAIASDAPGRYTTNISKARRQGRILIDYLRNGRGATAIEAFSTRARHGAPVAAPIRWDELTPRMRSDRFDIRSLPRRLASLRSDPWAELPVTRQAITAKMKRAVGMRSR